MRSFLAVASMLSAAVPQAQALDPMPCSDEISHGVALGLAHALEDARDLPDFGLLVQPREPIYISSYLWGSECVVDGSVLPESSEQTFVLVSQGELSELAAQRRGDIVHVDAGDVRVLEGEIRLWLRVAIETYLEQGPGLACCCGGELVFRGGGENWEFLEWSVMVCA